MSGNKVNDKLQEIIDSFTLEGESWGKDELIREYANGVKELKNNATDEIGLEWDGEELMTLDDFIVIYFGKVIEGVCNVLEGYKE